MKRIVVLLVAVAIAVPWISLAAWAPARPALAASDSFPDLGMAQLKDFRIERRSGGQRLLRFSSIVVNVGDGPFELHGSRPDANTPTMTVTQRIFDDTGNFRNVEETGATMYFGGDGHNHWHVRDLESFTLERLSDKKKVGTGAKHGFCFFDNYKHKLSLPSAPQTPRYTGCGKSGDHVVEMGLSVGWGDIYGYTLPDQYIDITGLRTGRYRLTATADAVGDDPDGWFVEASEDNNSTWVDLQIRKGKVKAVGYGPNA